jgi:hypothetical protein
VVVGALEHQVVAGDVLVRRPGLESPLLDLADAAVLPDRDERVGVSAQGGVPHRRVDSACAAAFAPEEAKADVVVHVGLVPVGEVRKVVVVSELEPGPVLGVPG